MGLRSLAALLMSLSLLSCGGDPENNFGSGSGGSATPPGNSTKEVTVPAGTFELTLTSPMFSSHLLHKAGLDFEEPCALDPKATGADRFIDCEVEVDELDLLMFGLSFSTKISSDQCEHVSYTPYFFLSAPAGRGPAAVSYTIDDNPGAPGALPDPNGFSHNGEPYCPYDYSYIDGGPNCCTGEYTLTVTNISTSGDISQTVSTENWGGEIGNCISGAGKMDPTTTEGWPKTIYTANTTTPGTGLEISKEYNGIIGGFKARTIGPRTPVNGFNPPPAGHPAASGFGFISTFYANYYNPVTWGGAPPTGMIHPYYVFTCYDAAHEETGRIRLTVREWNLADSISPTNLTAADQGGFGSNGPNNDMGDWDDAFGMLNAPPAGSSTPEDFLDLQPGYPYFHIEP